MNDRNRTLCDEVGDSDSVLSFNVENDKKLRSPSSKNVGESSSTNRVTENDVTLNISHQTEASTTPSLERDFAADSPNSNTSQSPAATSIEHGEVTTEETRIPTGKPHVPILPPLVPDFDSNRTSTGSSTGSKLQASHGRSMDQSQRLQIADTPRIQSPTTGKKKVDDHNSEQGTSHCHFAQQNTKSNMIAAQSLHNPQPSAQTSPSVQSYVRQEANKAQETMQNRQRQYWQVWTTSSSAEHPQHSFVANEEYLQRSRPQLTQSPPVARISPRRIRPTYAHSHSSPLSLSSSPVISLPKTDIPFTSSTSIRSSSFGGDSKYDGTQSSPVSSNTTHFSGVTQTQTGVAGPGQHISHLRHPPPTTHVYFPVDRASSPGVGLVAHGTFMPSSPRGGARSTPLHNHGPRTPPEVLKTLLRKKACLYEAGTSYAIALVTWLVGRSLTINSGYFSRQELQYGVHQVVSDVIDSRSITRTKVNRCMQIILNSCFHYIIPHPDDDESSKRFRKRFSERSTNDSHLLHNLDPPWVNLDVDSALKEMLERGPDDTDTDKEDEVNERGEGKDYKKKHREGEGSPKLTFQWRVAAAAEAQEGTHAATRESEQADSDGEGGSVKRVVLLCFNENVTSFEDVWRCHNEFIRDVARSGNWKLTAQEWKEFFTRETSAPATSGRGAPSVDSSSEEGSRSSLSPRLRPPRSPTRPDIGPPIPEFSLDGRLSYAAAAAHHVGDAHTEIDHRFGVMDENELSKFRTSWCMKRYDHDPRVCTFAHTQVNQGWLRRNPKVYHYKDEFCPNIMIVRPNPQHFLEGCSFNRCPLGVLCEFCHSQEEMEYHPNRYKRQATCPLLAKDGDLFENCDRDHSCPYLHPIKTHHPDGRLHRRSDSGGLRYGGQYRTYQQHPRSPRLHSKSHSSDVSSLHLGDTPPGSPMMYISPAPESSFEKFLTLPGLQSLFRQHASVLYSHMTADPSQEMICKYLYFGNHDISSTPPGDKGAQLKTSGV